MFFLFVMRAKSEILSQVPLIWQIFEKANDLNYQFSKKFG